MTIIVRKLHLAIAVLAVALIAPATALATHVFDDVEHDRYYSDAAEWAAAEGITTGVSTDPPLFAPDEPVTRGQNVTFLERYHDNLVQPGLDALEGAIGDNRADIATNSTEISDAEADIATNTADIADNAADLATKADASQVYTQAEVDAAVTAALLGTATIPSGTTVTGSYVWDNSVVNDDGDVLFSIDLPGRTPETLSDSTVNFAPATDALDPDATCTGTPSAPTAPAGKVCLYVYVAGGIDGLMGVSHVPFRDRSFLVRLRYDGSPGDDAFLYLSWAYTAP